MQMSLVLFLAAQSVPLPQTIPALEAELRRLIPAKVIGTNSDGTKTLEIAQIVEINECRIAIRRTVWKKDSAGKKLREIVRGGFRFDQIDGGFEGIHDWGGFGLWEFAFNFSYYDVPKPGIVLYQTAKPWLGEQKWEAIGVSFNDINNAGRAERIVRSLSWKCANQ